MKAVLFALLVANTVWYIVAGTTSKALDAAAWLVLLALYDAEIRFSAALAVPPRRLALRIARLLAAAGVIAATAGYVFEDNALDAANSALWIAVVVLLEIQFRFPRAVARARVAFTGAAVVLYGSLAVLIGLWAVRGEWFDAYDAAVWLAAFVLIEMNVGARSTALTAG